MGGNNDVTMNVPAGDNDTGAVGCALMGNGDLIPPWVCPDIDNDQFHKIKLSLTNCA